MLEPVDGTPLRAPPWQAFDLDRTLMYYDGPKLLLRRTSAGQFFLAWWSDADADMERWVYLPVSESRLYQVLSGDIPSRQALSNPEDGYLFVTDVEYSGEVRNVVLTDIESIPNDALPRPDARLNITLPEEIGRVAHRDRAHVVDITLQSEDQETGRVAARVFGSFVANFQRLFDALGQAKAGQASRYGPVSQSVLNRTKLGMIASYAGSFGVRFETQEQDDMFGESLARESLDALFGLLEAEDNLAGLTSHLRVLRGRVATNYQELLKTIEASRARAGAVDSPRTPAA